MSLAAVRRTFTSCYIFPEGALLQRRAQLRSYLMWWLLSVLALCPMPALWADACSGLPADASKGLEYWPDLVEANPPPLSFHLSVKHGGPDFRITVRPVSFSSWMNKEGIDQPWFYHGLVHAGDIVVARCQDGKQLQSLLITAWQPIDFGRTFHVEDLNFDGYLDFSVLTEFAGGYRSRSYWVYDPASGLFVQNPLTRELGKNCLRTENGGCWKAAGINFDQEKREISTYYLMGCPGDSIEAERDRYTVKDNRLILIHRAMPELAQNGSCTLTVSDLVDGTMRVTKVRRFDAPRPSPEAPPPQSPDAQSPNSREVISSVSGELLYERPLDGQKGGLFSNTGKGQQVGGAQFVFPDAVHITGIRWYEPTGTGAAAPKTVAQTFRLW